MRNSKFKWSLDSLLFQVNSGLEEDWLSPISKDQLQQDLDIMKAEFKAPIQSVKDGNTIYFEYSDDKYSLQTTTLQEEDMVMLEEASNALKKIKSISFSDEISLAINLVESRLKLNPEERSVVHYENFGWFGDTAHIRILIGAILSRQVLKIVYRKLGNAQHDIFLVHPYFLKEYQGRRYLFGYSETSKGPRLYALDRICELQNADSEYINNKFISSDIYFNSLIGVMVNGSSKAEDIALWISPKMAPFVISKPIHSTQFRENYDHSGLFIQIRVVINPELVATLLSYGPELKVLYPAHLADQIKETAWKIAEQYNRE